MQYELKYGKKIKMKKSKKDKEGENQRQEEVMEAERKPMIEMFKGIIEKKKEIIVIEIEPEQEPEPLPEVHPEMPEKANGADPAIIE